jgi:arylsulfatase A-like enzyme
MKAKKLFPIWLLTFLSALLYVSCTRTEDVLKCPDCNVILISIDSLRADHLGSYGYRKDTSPNIDRFSQDAVLFTRCMVQGTSTLISHASLFTSLIPSHHGASFTQKYGLSEDTQTIASIMKENGYATVSFNEGGQLSAKFGMDQGFDVYDSGPEKRNITDLCFSRIVDKGISWLEQNPEKKYFMFLHTYGIHHPYTPTQEYLDRIAPGYKGPLGTSVSVDLIYKAFRGEMILEDEEKENIVLAYDAEIRRMDDAFGVLIDFLKKTGLYDNTIIVLTSDHGEEFDDHGKIGMHAHTLFNELLNVPLIIKLPGSRSGGKVLDPLVASIDISPTLLDLVDLPGFPISDGISLSAAISGEEQASGRFLISQRDHPDEYADPRYWAIVSDKWKLYDDRLYDLENDPGERTDVSGQHRELKESLAMTALKFMSEKPGEHQKARSEMDEELIKRLKSLGYIK